MPLIGKSLTKSLSYVLESIYTPTPLPMPLEYIFPFLDEVTPDQADFDKSEQDCFSLQKDFVLPICHTDQLAVDLASFCGLTIEQALDLSKSLPSYLIDAQMPQKSSIMISSERSLKYFAFLPDQRYTTLAFHLVMPYRLQINHYRTGSFLRNHHNTDEPSTNVHSWYVE
jgi:hypothetical protein